MQAKKTNSSRYTERRKMNEGMTENQTKRLIEWLKSKGMTAEQIVECLEYINSKQKKVSDRLPNER